MIQATDPDKYSSTTWTWEDLQILQDAMARGLAEHELFVPFPDEEDLKKNEVERIL